MSTKAQRAAIRAKNQSRQYMENAAGFFLEKMNQYIGRIEGLLTEAHADIEQLTATATNQAAEITDLKHQNARLTRKLTNILRHRQMNKEKRENKIRAQETQIE